MAGLMLLTLLLSMAACSSEKWCVCKEGVSDKMLQETLDYACGAGAECAPIHSKGPCYNPNTVRAHCNYAANSYFQNKGQTQGSCNFSGAAVVSTTNPSYSGCVYPSSASPVTTAPVTTTAPSSGTTTPGTSTTTPVGNSPFLTTPTGVLGPSGTGINTDLSDGGVVILSRINFFAFLIAIVASGFMF